MSGDGYDIAGYRPQHKRLVAEVQRQLWSPDVETNLAYFEWKYEQNPLAGDPLVYLALHDGKVVGMRGAYGARWLGPGGEVRWVALHADDLVIDPRHRNRGLLRPLMQAMLHDLSARGHEYVLSLSASPVTYLSSLTMGWRSVGSTRPLHLPSPRHARVTRVRQRVKRLPVLWRLAAGRRLLGSAAEREPYRRLDAVSPQALAARHPRVSVSRSPRVDEMAAVARRTEDRARIRHTRDTEYLGWRLRNPLCSFRFLFHDDARGLQGYLILQRYVSPLANHTRVSIVDWVANDDSARRALLNAAVRLGAFPELLAWSASCSPTENRMLNAAGFRPLADASRTTGHRPGVLLRRLGPDAADADWTREGRRLLDPANWDLRLLFAM